jgi:hypothetical protein
MLNLLQSAPGEVRGHHELGGGEDWNGPVLSPVLSQGILGGAGGSL